MNGPSSVINFDVLHNDSSEVTREEIKESLVSANETWLLMLVHSNGHDEVRLLRLDGKDEQNLYCSPNGAQLESMQWSPDQTYIAWSLIPATDRLPDLYLLNLHSGQITRVAQATRYKGLPATPEPTPIPSVCPDSDGRRATNRRQSGLPS